MLTIKKITKETIEKGKISFLQMNKDFYDIL